MRVAVFLQKRHGVFLRVVGASRILAVLGAVVKGILEFVVGQLIFCLRPQVLRASGATPAAASAAACRMQTWYRAHAFREHAGVVDQTFLDIGLMPTLWSRTCFPVLFRELADVAPNVAVGFRCLALFRLDASTNCPWCYEKLLSIEVFEILAGVS